MVAAQRGSSYAWPRRSSLDPAMVSHGAAGGRGDDSTASTVVARAAQNSNSNRGRVQQRRSSSAWKGRKRLAGDLLGLHGTAE